MLSGAANKKKRNNVSKKLTSVEEQLAKLASGGKDASSVSGQSPKHVPLPGPQDSQQQGLECRKCDFDVCGVCIERHRTQY